MTDKSENPVSGHIGQTEVSWFRAELKEINGTLTRLDEAIRGNGKLGIMVRLDRLEVSRHRWMRFAWTALGVGSAIAARAAWQVLGV